MTDYYKNTRKCIDDYNQLLDYICTSYDETTDEQDELLQNHMIYLAHALIKDIRRDDDLKKIAGIIFATIG